MRHEPAVRGYAVTHPPGTVQLPTQPGWDLVVYAVSGLFDALTDDDAWLVPAHRAMCVPDGIRVRVLTREPTTMRCLYIRRAPPEADEGHDDVGRDAREAEPARTGVLGEPFTDVRVVDVTPLTRELLLRAVASAPLDLDDELDRALITLTLAELSDEPASSLRLPLPHDDRARAVAVRIVRDPATRLGDALGGVGASRRTVERLVVAQTGLTLTAWRRRARVMAAIELLTDGMPVTAAAARVGYSTPSSFVAAFRTELGTTPKRFVADRARTPA